MYIYGNAFNNPLTPGAVHQEHIFWTFWRFSALICAKLVPIPYSRRHLQHDSMSFFQDILCLGLCAEINSILFFCLSFFSFPYLFTAVIDPLLDLFPFWETIIESGDFCHGVQPLVYFAASFSIKFLSNIIVHISDSIESITWIWVSLERSFPPLELEYIRPCQFWFWWHQK